jgi:hypothetical protein
MNNKLLSIIYPSIKINKIKEIIQVCDQNTLVIWDVDGVFIIGTDRIFHSENLCDGLVAKYVDYIVNKYALNKEKKEWFISQILMHRPIRLVDNTMIDLMQELRTNKIKTIALTHCFVGTLGNIKNVADWRIDELSKLGINFDLAFQDVNEIELNNLDQVDGYYPLYKQGVLFCLKEAKGEALGALLEQIKWYPKKIVFIDDKIFNLESVQAELKQKNIDFIGLHYVGALDLPKDINDKVVKFQYEYLMEQGKWLTDQKALRLLKNNT